MTGLEERAQETEGKYTSQSPTIDKKTVITEREIRTTTTESMRERPEIQIIK